MKISFYIIGEAMGKDEKTMAQIFQKIKKVGDRWKLFLWKLAYYEIFEKTSEYSKPLTDRETEKCFAKWTVTTTSDAEITRRRKLCPRNKSKNRQRSYNASLSVNYSFISGCRLNIKRFYKLCWPRCLPVCLITWVKLSLLLIRKETRTNKHLHWKKLSFWRWWFTCWNNRCSYFKISRDILERMEIGKGRRMVLKEYMDYRWHSLYHMRTMNWMRTFFWRLYLKQKMVLKLLFRL